MRYYVRTLCLLLCGIGLTAALVYAFWPKPVDVEITPVTTGPLQVTVNEDGKTRIRERYMVSAPLGGQLQRIELRPGDPVERGKTLIASIQPQSPHMLDARELAQAEARVKAGEARVKRSQRTLKGAQAALKYAESELRRAQAVADDRIISRSELENSEMLFRTRSEEYEAARYAEDIATFELELARAALLLANPVVSGKELPANLDIKSPIDGEVLRIHQESSRVVAPATPLVELGDPNDLEVEVDVLSGDAVKIRPGAQVWIEHWGGDHRLKGRVRTIEPSGFTKVSALGVEEQRVNVIIDLVNSVKERSQLKDNFRVEARIVTWESPHVTKVPVSTLFRDGDHWAVFVINGRHAHLSTVRVGHRNGWEAEILQGLQPADQVVVHPSEKLRDGAAVLVKRSPADPEQPPSSDRVSREDPSQS